MFRNKRIILLLVVILMITSTFLACSNDTTKENTVTKKQEDTTTKEDSKDVTKETEDVEFSYPMDSSKKLTYYIGKEVHPDYVSQTDQPTYQIFNKLVGVDIEFSMSTGDEEQTFNLMLASGDLPDIVAHDWRKYPGGVEAAIDDQYIIKLNDIFPKYAPNLASYLAENPSIDKEVKTDSGTYAYFPFLRGDDYLTIWAGPCVRDDMLAAVNIDAPATIDDWTEMLTLFKTELGAEAPLGYLSWLLPVSQTFAQAYGVIDGFYQVDGEVRFGATQDVFKDYLLQLRQWYADGLIDPDISAIDDNIIKANVVIGKTGAIIGTTSRLSTYNFALSEAGIEGNLIGVSYPVLNKGDKPFYTQKNDRNSTGLVAAISTTCDDVELAARVCDFAYSEEGILFANFGEEGVSYNLVDGSPVITQEISDYPGGIIDSLSRYNLFYNGSFPMIHDRIFYEATFIYDQQKEGISQWSTDTQVNEHRLSESLSPTAEESEEYAALWTEINTYNSEMLLKFMFGDVDINASYNEYVETLNKLGLERVLELKQAQLDRFNGR